MTFTYQPVGLRVTLWFPTPAYLRHPVWELRAEMRRACA